MRNAERLGLSTLYSPRRSTQKYLIIYEQKRISSIQVPSYQSSGSPIARHLSQSQLPSNILNSASGALKLRPPLVSEFSAPSHMHSFLRHTNILALPCNITHKPRINPGYVISLQYCRAARAAKRHSQRRCNEICDPRI